MFYAPIRHTPLKTVKEILDFSCDTETSRNPNESKTKIFFTKDSNIFICTENGKIFVTPYRDEIPIILKESSFSEEFFDGKFLYFPTTHSYRYCILAEIAKREIDLKIYKENFEKSKNKGFKNNPFPKNLDFTKHELFSSTIVGINTSYEIIPLFSGNDENCNLCTFILLKKDNYLLLCDEYGRSFWLNFGSIEDLSTFVNFLFESGYTYTTHPEKYLFKQK